MAKKIAIIINTLATGGAEKTAGLLINQLSEEMEIHLLMFDTTNIEFEIPASVKVYQIGKPTSADARPIQVLMLPYQAWQIKKYLNKHSIPLVFSILNRPNFIAGYLKIFGYKGNTILNERSNASYYYSHKTMGGMLGRLLIKRLYCRANLIITNSIFCKKELQQTFGLKNNIITISNGINFLAIQKRKKTVKMPFHKIEGEFIFCHIGRYHPHKNQALLLQAFALIKDLNCRLLMVGKNIPQQLEGLVKEFGLQDRVILFDRQTDILPFYAVSDAFVLSSNVEGYPNVIIEAMACGLPVIATDCKWGPREILAPETGYPPKSEAPEWAQNGLLVPVNNAPVLADAMQQLMQHRDRYKEYINKIKPAMQNFDEEKTLKLFTGMINSFYN
jgi:N-acetylgalactosamine-N,N'-diacetylbacillosaminyl-diphospho-undecaprenol 4-alpha-N-acetylgalactosaminyltransferase